MKTVRRYILAQTITCLVAVVIGGLVFPSVHRLEHADAARHAISAAQSHSHGDHGDAVEMPHPDLVADTCAVCARNVDSTAGVESPSAVPSPDSERVQSFAPQFESSNTFGLTSTRAPPVLI